MTAFVWANFPLCALIFGAMAGIPLWLVLTRSGMGAGPSFTRRVGEPVCRAGQSHGHAAG